MVTMGKTDIEGGFLSGRQVHDPATAISLPVVSASVDRP